MNNSWKNNNLLFKINEGSKRNSPIEDVPVNIPVIAKINMNQSNIIENMSKDYDRKYIRGITSYFETWSKWTNYYHIPRGYLLGYFEEENTGDLFDHKMFHAVSDASISYPCVNPEWCNWSNERDINKISDEDYNSKVKHWLFLRKIEYCEKYIITTRSLDEFINDAKYRMFGPVDMPLHLPSYSPKTSYSGGDPLVGGWAGWARPGDDDYVTNDMLPNIVPEKNQNNFITTITYKGNGIPIKYFDSYKLAEDVNPRLKTLVEDII